MVVNGCLAAVVLVLAVGAYVLLFRDDGAAKAGAQSTVDVARGSVEASVSATGTVDPVTSANADFGTSGTVEKINVKEGESVDEGDVLARLDDTAAKQALSAARTKLTAAQQSLDELEDQDECDDDSSDSSSDSSSGSGQEGAAQGCVTQSQLTSSQAEVDSAEAAVSSAEDAVDATKLRAPISGKVVAVNGTVGSSATGGSGSGDDGSSGDDSSADEGSAEPGGSGGSGSGSGGTSSGSLDTESGFVVIADTDDLIVNASFAEADIAKLKKSQQASVTFPALPDEQTTGKVTSIDLAPSSDSDVVRYGVRVTVSDPPKGLRLGQTAELSVVVDRATDVLYVPTIAVTGTGSQATVDVLRDGKTTTTQVTVGLRGDANTEITSGLEEGDKVVLATASDADQGGGGGGPGGGIVRRGGEGGGGGKPAQVVKP